MNHISITEKVIVLLVLLGLAVISITATFSYITAENAILDRTFSQLTSVRVKNKKQLEQFFSDRIKTINWFSTSGEINSYFIKLIDYQNSKRNSATLEKENLAINEYLNSSNYYAEYYIVNNDSIVYNFDFSKEKKTFRFADDSLLISKLLASNLFDTINLNKQCRLIDFGYVDKKLNLFLLAPVFDKNKSISAMLALKISESAINNIIFDNNPLNGLGKTGESYLVGYEYIMRSNSRFLNNDSLITVKTSGVELALKNNEGISIYQDYRNIAVLASYSSFNYQNLNWAILAEIDLSEAMIPIYSLRNKILAISIMISLFVMIFAYIMSRKLTESIVALKLAAIKLGNGDYEAKVEIKSNDEIGDLSNTFNKMAAQLKLQEEQLKKERQQRLMSLLDGQEMERKRLSRELHDGLAQSVIALKLQFENVVELVPKEAEAEFQNIVKYLNTTIEEIRTLSNNLMPVVLQQFGLVNALRHLCDSVSNQKKTLVCFESSGNVDFMEERQKTYLYRIAQEVLNNAIKHSQANEIKMSLLIDEKNIELFVQDNGKGFNFDKKSVKDSHGLYNIQERTFLLNGRLDITSKVGSGTQIEVKIPITKIEKNEFRSI